MFCLLIITSRKTEIGSKKIKDKSKNDKETGLRRYLIWQFVTQ